MGAGDEEHLGARGDHDQRRHAPEDLRKVPRGLECLGRRPRTKLAKEAATLRGPDVAVVRADRVPKGKGAASWLDGAPDLAVEVKGDDQSVAERMRKALEYIKAGTKQVWLLDPVTKELMLVTPPDQVRVLGRGDVLQGGELLPGFQCRVAELFE
jgi:Uma2 family endonuclease